MSHCSSEKAQKKKILEEEIEQVAKEIKAGGTDLKNDPVLRENINLENLAVVNYKVRLNAFLIIAGITLGLFISAAHFVTGLNMLIRSTN